MRLLIVRHGPAGEREDWAKTGKPDWRRPLTKSGRRKIREASSGLKKFFGSLDLIATSPWTRAAQTAEILSRELGAKILECPALIPDRSLTEAVDWLKSRRESTIALVGHEPHLGRLASWLTGGSGRSFVFLKKGQAVLLDGDPATGKMELIWSLPPKALRAL